MPALKPVPNVLKCQFRWNDSTDTDVYSNLYYSFSGGSPSTSDAVDIAQGLFGAMTTAANMWRNSVQLTGCTVTDLTSSTAAQGEFTGSQVGGNMGTILAGGTATVVSYQIARRYRGGKPRNYFPWGSGSDLLNAQSWATAYITEVNGAWATYAGEALLVTGGGTTITNHVNVSYYEGNDAVIDPRTGRAKNYPVPRATPLVDVIHGFTVRIQPGSQRRRNR